MKLSKEAVREIADELERVSDSKDSGLSLTCLDLTSLPDDFVENIAEIENRRRFKVKSLCLNENRFKEIPECVSRLRYVESLEIVRNQIEVLPDWLHGCRNRLTALYLAQNKLANLPLWFRDMELIDLDLALNPLKDVQSIVLNLEKLESLDMSGLRLTQWTHWLENARNLRSLSLDRNKLTSIPDWLFQLKHLEWLNLGSNRIKRIPDSFTNMQNLKGLEVRGNKGIIIPDCVRAMRCGISADDFSKAFTKKTPTVRAGAQPDGFEKIRGAETETDFLTTEQIIRRLKKWERVCSFVVEVASERAIELRFDRLPENLEAFVQEVYSFSPDEVDECFSSFGVFVEDAKKRNVPVPSEIASLSEGLDLNEENVGFKLLRRSLLRTKTLKLWWA